MQTKTAYNLAVADYSKSIAFDNECFKVYEARADIYIVTGEYDKAIADYTYLLERPKIGWLFYTKYYDRGYAYACEGEYDKALADYSKLIEYPHLAHFKMYTKNVASFTFAGISMIR